MTDDDRGSGLYRLLTTQEAADWLRISRSQFSAMVAEGKFPVKPYQLSDRIRLFPLWGLIALVSRETGAPMPDHEVQSPATITCPMEALIRDAQRSHQP